MSKIADKINMFLKIMVITSLFFVLSACSTMQTARMPAEDPADCKTIVQNILLKDNYQKDLEQALVDKKLISRVDKFVTIEHPRLEWINRARVSLNKSIKNWNNNKYPAFYIFNDEDIINEAKKYFQTLDSIVTPDTAVDPEATKNLEIVEGWVKSFENYQTDIDNLLEERISLQYNLSLLKKLKLKEESRDIKLVIKKDGKLTEEIITLKKSDKDLGYQVQRLKSEIALLDGKMLRNGKIKERVIRQAMLVDILNILQKEFEYAIKNTDNPHPELLKELERINTLIKNPKFDPTTYGVYRITNKVFMRELFALSKLDLVYKKFVETPALKIKDILSEYLKNRANKPDEPGLLKKIYARITNMSPKQAALGTGVAAVAGIGIERYFWINKKTTTELEDQTHAEEIEATEEVQLKESQAHSEAVDAMVDELLREYVPRK